MTRTLFAVMILALIGLIRHRQHNDVHRERGPIRPRRSLPGLGRAASRVAGRGRDWGEARGGDYEVNLAVYAGRIASAAGAFVIRVIGSNPQRLCSYLPLLLKP